MFLFYVLSFFKIGDTIQGGTLFKGDNNKGNTVFEPSKQRQGLFRHNLSPFKMTRFRSFGM